MTGAYPHDHHHGHGCGCHSGPPMRMCRRDSKELLVEDTGTGDTGNTGTTGTTGNPATGIANLPGDAVAGRTGTTGRAIIGGGCCVSLSVEYMPSTVSLASPPLAFVEVTVTDAAGTALAWIKEFKEGYHVQECIITTNPGAILRVFVKSAIARVRWCEVFSC
ncbi:MAG TPA: hypothetical protein VMH28_14475 [Candidatus Acidoferrales bacterium]|nr:hypothetical protein [Candidatus Acidoferrales bacterium]